MPSTADANWPMPIGDSCCCRSCMISESIWMLMFPWLHTSPPVC